MTQILPSLEQTLSASWLGWLALVLFFGAYLLVILEEIIDLRKSKAVTLCAGLIWILVAYAAHQANLSDLAEKAFEHNLFEYAELLLFLLVAIIYINLMEDLQVFEVLKQTIVGFQLSYKQLFWCLGICTFFLSAVADNLTTALVMCSIAMAICKEHPQPKFIGLMCVNIVVAANAGGAFSPFGDITTLMVWQKGMLSFTQFFELFIPSVLNYLVPAIFMGFAVPVGKPQSHSIRLYLSNEAKAVILFFLLTIMLAVCCQMFLGMPPVLGMMTGFAFVQLQSFYLKKKYSDQDPRAFDVYSPFARAEWDTLLFFYGIILCVGGLASFGYLQLLASSLYGHLGQSFPAAYQALPANILVGLCSAIVDNIPIMYAILTMHPQMPEPQWLLVTLTVGTGGSLLAIGSAAGVALLGQAKGQYTFMSHLKWTWAILLGYIVSILSLVLMHAK